MLQSSTETWHIMVPDGTQNDRADRVLLPLLPHSMTRSQFQRLFEMKKVLCRGEAIPARYKLGSGEKVEIQKDAPTPSPLTPGGDPLPVLYEDSDVAVLNKPQGLAVHSASSNPNAPTVVQALLAQLDELSGIGGELRPGIVHRLDKDTSGALLVTKNDRAHQIIAEQFSLRTIEKKYFALCYGTLKDDALSVDTMLGRSFKDRKKMASLKSGGRQAISHFKVVENYLQNGRSLVSLVEVEILTGRTHQIRVHAAENHISVVGDPLYGVPTSRHTKWLQLPKPIRDAIVALPGQMLHARVLTFIRPSDRSRVEAIAPPSVAFSHMLALLRETLDVQCRSKAPF